jgi:hypothetical protein
MVCFAVVGPTWKADSDYSLKSYRILSLTLMTSRLVLAIQYGHTLYFTGKRHRNTILPLALVIGTYILSAIMYGAFTAGFVDTKCSTAAIIGGTCKPKEPSLPFGWFAIGFVEIVGKFNIANMTA